MMHIVLVEPEIPQNTGNIARTCAATGAKLHLIKPLGFELSDRYLKRAGLDYWHMMTYEVHENWQAFLEANPGAILHYATTKAPRGAGRGAAVGQLRPLHPHSDGSRRPLPQPLQLRRHRPL